MPVKYPSWIYPQVEEAKAAIHQAKTEAVEQHEAGVSSSEAESRRNLTRYLSFPPHQSLVGTQRGAQWRREAKSRFEVGLGEWKESASEKFYNALASWEVEAYADLAAWAKQETFPHSKHKPTAFTPPTLAEFSHGFPHPYPSRTYAARRLSEYRFEMEQYRQAKYKHESLMETSREFWTGVGYPEYIGYPPVEIPEGYKIGYHEVTEEGLKIEFEPLPETIPKLMEAESRERMQTAFWKAVGYPEYSEYGMISIPQGYKIGRHEVTEEGLQLEFEPLPATIPKLMEAESARRMSEHFWTVLGYPEYVGYPMVTIPSGYKIGDVEKIGGQLQVKFKPEQALLKPETQRVHVAAMPRGRVFTDFGAAPGAPGAYTKKLARESERFYENIGFPEYAGKYKPFTVPEGFKVAAVTESHGELQVSFESLKPKGVAETILEFDIPTYFADIFGLKGEKRERYLQITGTLTSPITILPKPWGAPVESLAGLAAYPETLAHNIIGLAGAEAPTRPPPSPEKTEGYTTGYAMGMVGASLLIGKAIEISPLGKLIGKIETRILKTATKPLKATGIDKWLYERSGYWRSLHGPLPPQIVAPPSHLETASKKGLEAVSMSWILETTPRTSAVTIGKSMMEATQYVPMKHLIFKGGVLSVGYLQELGFSKEALKTAPEQLGVTIQKRVEGVMPYVPTPIPTAAVKSLPGLIGLTWAFTPIVSPEPSTVKPETLRTLTIPKTTGFIKYTADIEALKPVTLNLAGLTAAPKKLTTVLKPETFRKTREKAFTFPIPRVETWGGARERAAALSIPMQKSRVKTGISTKQLQKQAQALAQIQTTIPVLQTKMLSYPFEFRLPRKRKRTSKRKKTGAGRYPRFYPVKTAKQLLEVKTRK